MNSNFKKRLLYKFLNTTACLVAVTAFAHDSFAAPEGSLVIGGSALITQVGAETLIQQNSNRAIIRWDSFDVAQNEKVKFQQPSANSITINRITDTKASRIDGNISANGKLIMMNPNGIMFGATSRVDVGSLVATSSDIEDDLGFMAGGPAKFTKSGNPNAKIINAGIITAKEAGLVGLVAPNVENSGIIQARLGKVQLASGDIHTIDLAGDGLIKLEISDQVLSRNVKNTGTLQADGGEILMTAAQGRAALDAIISNHGRIQTGTVFAQDGQVVKKGSVKITAATTKGENKTKIINGGTIVADGGSVQMIADNIQLESTSNISVAADNGGGTVNIGGARQGGSQGGSSLPTAQFVNVEAGSIIDASALKQGNGGEVILWSDMQTNFGGQVISNGGSIGGNGGEVEISSKGRLNYQGFTDLTAANGRIGNLLLDPTDILISTAPDQNMSGSSPFDPTIDDGPSILNVSTLTNALGTANVTVQTRATGSQQGNITVDAPISWASGNTLTLDAHHNIMINQAISGQNLTLIAGNDISIGAALTGTGTLSILGQSASTTMGIGTGQAGVLSLNATDIGNITNGWSDIIIGRTDGTGAINVGARTWNDNLTLQSATGIITINGTQTMGANTLTISTDAAPVINAGLTGTGTLNLRGNTASTTMGFGTGQAGAFFLSTAAIGNITNGWNNIVIGRTDGTGNINIGAMTWNDNLTLQSNTGSIIIGGTQTLGANNVTFTTNGDPQINAAMNSTGTLTFQGVDDATTIGVGTGQPGMLSISTADLANADNTWSNIVIGRTTQTGALNIGGVTLADPMTLQTGTGTITIGGNISMGANNLNIQTDSDLEINGNLSGTGSIYILPLSDTTTIGIGNSQAGMISIDDAEQTRILNGWGNILIGKVTGTGDINIGPDLTWNDNVYFRTMGQVAIHGNQNFGANDLRIQTDSDPIFNGNLNGGGIFLLTQITPTVSIGLGDGQTDIINLTNAELNRIMNGWTSITFGMSTASGDLNIGAYTWQDPLILMTGTGIINVNGDQNMGSNNLNIRTDSNLNIGANLTGTGTLTIAPNGNTSMGIGTGQTGTIQLTDAEVARITNGWASLIFGTTTSTAVVNVGALTWNDNVTFRSGSGIMTLDAQTMGSNNLSLLTNANLAISGALIGTGALTIAPNGNITVGVGLGQTGTLQLSDAELNHITDGWNSITIGSTTSTAAVNVGSRTWNDNLTLNSGTGLMTINGAQYMGANNLTIQTNSNLSLSGTYTDIALNGSLFGTGILTIRGSAAATSMSLGTGQTGTLNLNDTEILNIADGWSRIDFGYTAATGVFNIGAATWNDSVRFITGSGAITINGTQTMGANNLDISTNANPTFNAALTETGTLTILGSSAATTIGIGDGQTGTLHLSNTDLAYIAAGWNNIIFGANNQTGAMNIGGYNWQYDTTFRTGSGLMTVNGANNAGPRNMTFETNSNLALNAPLTGTGILTIRGSSNATSMGIGTGQAGTLSLTDTELNRIADGWEKIVFGQNASTGAVNLGTRTWTDNLHLVSGTGQMTVAGIQNMGSNNLTLETDSNLAINAALNGTGHLAIHGASLGTTIGVNGAAGTLALSTAEIANITDGWGSVTIGRRDMTGALSLGTATWQNPTSFMTHGDINVSGVQTSTETSGNALVFVTQAGLFTNTAGASAINPGGGRYLIYTPDAGSTTLGGLSPPTTINGQTYFSLYPSDVVPTGHVLIYGTGAAKVLLLQIDDKSKVYGDTNPIFTYTYLGGLQGSDTLSSVITGYTLNAVGTSLTDNAGTTWAITGSFLTALGYSTNVINGTMTVAKAPVLVQPNATTRTYGSTNAVFTVTYIGLKNGETAGVIDVLATGTSTADEFSNVGTYSITTAGASDNNYIFNYATNVLTITKADLTVTADNKTREYGDANPALTYSYSGFMNGDTATDLTTLPTISTTATNTTNVGTSAITLAGGTDNNYNLVLVNGTLTIVKADLTVTADNKTREYGDANPALTYTFGSFKNGQTSAVLSALPTISTTATNTTGAGTTAITLAGGADTNYNYVFTNGTLTITKATLTATAQNAARDYGDANPALTVAYTGFKNGENSGVIDTLATTSTTATNTTNAGTAAITATGAADTNYDFVYVDGVLTINKADLTITADDKIREYGDANPALTYSFGSFKNGETSAVLGTLPTISTAANLTTNAGTSAITLTGGADTNYNYVLTNGTLTITKADLTITADDKIREYGDANPALTYIFGSFKNGETSAVLGTLPTISTAANLTTNAGTSAITLTGGADTNYNFILTNGTMTITKAPLVVKIDDATRAEGEPNPDFSYSVQSGLKNGDLDDVLSNMHYHTNTDIYTPQGTYVITGSGGTAINYYVSGYISGNLVITSGALPIKSLPATVYYSNSLGVKDNWDQWRDLISYEDDHFIETILFGNKSVKREYSQNTGENLIFCHQNLGTFCHSQM